MHRSRDHITPDTTPTETQRQHIPPENFVAAAIGQLARHNVSITDHNHDFVNRILHNLTRADPYIIPIGSTVTPKRLPHACW